MPSCPRHRAARFARSAGLACVALAMLAPTVAHADPPKPAAAAAPVNESTNAAHQHAARAHELYQQGAYHEAIGELEVALKLDPNGKDLIFNLGVVHEKLGDIEDAVRYFQRYEQMDLEPQERAKADAYLKRLQGARKEVEKPAEPAPAPAPLPPPPPPPPESHHGRFDWITASAAVVGVGGIVVGSVYGVRALADRPKTGIVTTDADGYADVQNAENTAHREAIVSDVCFAVGAAGLAATAVLFFARTRDSASPAQGSAGPKGASDVGFVVSGAPLHGGGALLLEARF